MARSTTAHRFLTALFLLVFWGVRDEAWGHHTSCTSKICSAADPMAVLDSNFRVRGTTNLRVVDASVFPKIPGYFIVAAIYMISEKALDAIVEDAK
jgi:choline dehydrogenase